MKMLRYSTARHIINVLLLAVASWLAVGSIVYIVLQGSISQALNNKLTISIAMVMFLVLLTSYISDYLSALGKQRDREYTERQRRSTQYNQFR